MIKLRVSICRKVGDPNYGSHGAGCDLEAELDSALLSDLDQLRAKIRQAYAICASAVAAELGEGGPARPAEPPAPRREREDDRPRERDQRSASPARSSGRPDSPPANGRQLMGWLKKRDEEYFERAQKIGKAHGYPWKIADWDEDQAADVYHELVRKQPAGSGQWGGGRPVTDLHPDPTGGRV